MNTSFHPFPALLAVAAALLAPPALAEFKPVSLASCQPYQMAYFIDPPNIRHYPDGIRNVSKTSQYVMCALPKGGNAWTNHFERRIEVYFRNDNAAYETPMSSNVCTLYAGSDINGNGMAQKTLTAKFFVDDYGRVTFDQATGPYSQEWDAATLMCKIAPRYTLEYISFEEGE